MAKFLKMEVWKLLKRNPGCHARDLSKQLGWEDYNTAKALQWLVKHGCAQGVGYSHARRFYAVAREPVDGRGLSAGSIMALKVPDNYMENLAKANAVRYRMMAAGTYKLKRMKQPKAAERVGAGMLTLERCWKLPSTFAPANSEGHDYGREGAPSDNAQEEAA